MCLAICFVEKLLHFVEYLSKWGLKKTMPQLIAISKIPPRHKNVVSRGSKLLLDFHVYYAHSDSSKCMGMVKQLFLFSL